METQDSLFKIHQLITETVPVFFFVYDLETRHIEYISPQFMNCVANSKVIKSLDPHDKLKSVISKSHQHKFDQFFDDLHIKNSYKSSVELKTGRIVSDMRWFEVNTFQATKESSKARKVVGHILDITKKKEQYEILNRENKRIENFINMMAHDLKGPLSNCSLIVDLLRELMTPEELGKYNKYLSILQSTSKESGELITRLLYFATLKGETSKLDLDLYDLRHVIKDVVEKMDTRIFQKDITISYDFPDYALEVLLDIPLFKQVIQNLLTNAVKFTPKGGKISFASDYVEDRHVQLSITDNGIGIPEAHVNNLFRNISAIKREGLDGEKSTGLGLYICQQVMRIHNGDIAVKSKENEGTTFTINLPIPNSSATYF